VILDPGRIEADQVRLKPFNGLLDDLDAGVQRAFAQPDQPAVGVDLDKQQVASAQGHFVQHEPGDFELAVRGPGRPGKRQARRQGLQHRTSGWAVHGVKAMIHPTRAAALPYNGIRNGFC